MLRFVTLARYSTTIGTQQVSLPIANLSDDLALALLITVDMGVSFMDIAGRELAELLAPQAPDIVVTIASMGIPVVHDVTRHLGLDQYGVLHKTPKIHLADAYHEPVRSITTAREQVVMFDAARVDAVAGKRVAIVDDVISTGASIAAALRLLRRLDAEVVAIGALATEAALWRETLADDAALVVALGQLPVFRPEADGSYREDWEG
jgi:adenine phosphoribosyltransferase